MKMKGKDILKNKKNDQRKLVHKLQASLDHATNVLGILDIIEKIEDGNTDIVW